MSWLQRQRDRLQALMAEYGTIAFVTYFVIFASTLAGFWWAIGQGVEVAGAAGEMGRIGGAYAATKLTQPIRIAATLLTTPLVAAVVRRVHGASGKPENGPQDPGGNGSGEPTE